MLSRGNHDQWMPDAEPSDNYTKYWQLAACYIPKMDGVSSPDSGQPPVFTLCKLNGTEALSNNYRYTVTLRSTEYVDMDALIGESIVITLSHRIPDFDGGKKLIHGMITSFEFFERLPGSHGVVEGFFVYTVTIEPATAVLDRGNDFRIWQEYGQKDIDLVRKCLAEHGFHDVEFKLPPRDYHQNSEYRVQYDESTMNFVHRTLERMNAHFFYRHETNRHIMVCVDELDAQCQTYPENPVQAGTDPKKQSQDECRFFYLNKTSRISPSRADVINQRYQSWVEPVPLGEAVGQQQPGTANVRVTEYPAPLQDFGQAEKLAAQRRERLEQTRVLYRGASNIFGLYAGCRVKTKSHDAHNDGLDLIVTRVFIEADPLGRKGFYNEFEAVPALVPYHPPRQSRPVKAHLQTARVVAENDEIQVNRHGSVKVRFFWDGYSRRGDKNTSCWVRVASPMAGSGRGTVFHPKNEDEVLVSFLNEDPDEPVITGSVYSGMNPPAEKPEKRPFVSHIKPSKGKHANHILIDDKKDKEMFEILAKKDYHLSALNDQNIEIQNNRTKDIGKDVTETIGGKRNVKITDSDDLTVSGKQTIAISKTRNMTVTEDATSTFNKNMTMDISKVLTVTAEGDIIITGKNISLESSEGNITIKSAKNFTTEAGKSIINQSTKDFINESGAQYRVEATKDIANKGKNILIEGKAVNVKASGNTVIKSNKVGMN